MKVSGCLMSVAVAGVMAMAGPAMGQLSGSGSHLPLPSPNPGAPTSQTPTLTSIVHPTSFSGVWTWPAQAPWHGTFTATGPVPSSGNTGTTVYDFSPLAAGLLPGGTLLHFGDLDDGSGGEIMTLQAFDSLGVMITGAWLDRPSHAWGTGSGGAGAVAVADMPSWSFSGGTYRLDGVTVPGNPTISFVLPTNQGISSLRLVKDRVGNGFGMSAPVPGPASMALLGVAGVVAARRRR